MTYTLLLKLDGLPKRTNNQRCNWRAKMAEARKWKQQVNCAVVLSGKLPIAPLERAKLTLTRHSAVEPDFDGLVSSFKHVIDGLIHAGVIVNDKMSNIGQPSYRWEFAPKKSGFITVEVVAVDSEAAA